MRNALTDDVVVGDERATRAERLGYRRRDRLHAFEVRTDFSWCEVGQPHDVSHRHHQRVPGEQWSVVEERDGDLVAEDLGGGDAPGDDIAEHARSRHSADVRACIHHDPPTVGYNYPRCLVPRPPTRNTWPITDVRGDRDRSG